jgi:starch synthase (maltosyl-transferring)
VHWKYYRNGRRKGEHDWQALAERVRTSILNLFLLEAGYLSDCLHAEPGQSAMKAAPDDALRPNQLLAITLGALGEGAVCRKILTACEELLVPGAIRSLADRSVNYPIPVVRDGNY